MAKKPSKPSYTFAEDPEKLRKNAEAVKREFEGSGAEEKEKSSFLISRSVLDEARRVVMEEKIQRGEYRYLSQLVELGLRLAIDKVRNK